MKTLNVLRKKAEKSNYSATGEYPKTQGMIIRDIHAMAGINEKRPESVKQLITLDKIEAAINLVFEIGIPLNENDWNSF